MAFKFEGFSLSQPDSRLFGPLRDRSALYKTAFSGESFSGTEGYQPGRALELAQTVYAFERSRFATRLGIDWDMSDAEFAEIRERCIAIGSHVIEAVRTSSYTGAGGSYENAIRYIRGSGLLFHDLLHAVTTYDMQKTLSPSFLGADSQLGNSQLLLEELEANLLWEFPDDMSGANSFQGALRRHFKLVRERTLTDIEQAAYAEGVSVRDATREYYDLWESVTDNPRDIYLERARAIYDEIRKGNRNILTRTFLDMTEGVRPSL